MEFSVGNYSIELIFENYEKWKCGKSFLLLIAHKKWKSKKIYAIYNQKFYKNSKICRQIGWIKYLPFNIKYIMVDINHKNIPFMFNVFI